MKRINALTIAGTDPSGGAGIQADLKTFSALGAYGCSVITALVAQNTLGVQSVYRIEPDFVAAQLDSVFSDVRIDTTKIGMLAETDIVEAVAERLARYQIGNVVLDTTDPSGGAGIQADLKTFSALGAYGCSAITALVAQNTRGVQSVYRIEPDFVAAQLDSVFSDVRIDTTKIGMLAETDIVEAVAERLARYRVANVVLDTVMLAKSGDPLLSASAVETLRQRLLPQVSLITPNLPEAAALLDAPHARNEREMLEQGRALLALGCGAVLMKGGHLDDAESPDWLFTREGEQRFTAPRVQTKNTHGTGCTLSAALAALRPRHADWAATVIEAKAWLSAALAQADSLEVGHGIGPVHHFHAWW